jgi:hypothetical protein
MFSFETHHHQQGVSWPAPRRLRWWPEAKISAASPRALKQFLWPVGNGADNDNFQIARAFDFPDQRAQHSSIKFCTEHVPRRNFSPAATSFLATRLPGIG